MLGVIGDNKRSKHLARHKFWKWYHRRVKKNDPDLTKEEAEELYKEWKELGEPGPDANWDDVIDLLAPPLLFTPCMIDPACVHRLLNPDYAPPFAGK